MFPKALYLFLSALLGFAGALELRGTEEGSCLRNIPYHEDVDPIWLDSLPFVSGGNKFYLYRHASVHPEFRQMREYEFYYEACFVKNTSFIEGRGSMHGFGRTLGSFDMRASSNLGPGVFVTTPSNPGSARDYYTMRVTLTDYRTFAVIVQCLEATNQRGYAVYSIVPQLDSATEKLIEDHVLSLRFRRENVVFLRYNDCENLEEAFHNHHRSEPHSKGNQPENKWGDGVGHPPRSLKRNVISPIVKTVRTTTTTTTRRPPTIVTTTWKPTANKKILPSVGAGSGGDRWMTESFSSNGGWRGI